MTLGSAPDLAVSKTDGVASASPGSTLTYTIVTTNVGARDATGVSIIDTLGAHLEFVSATDGGTYDPVTRDVTWPAQDLAGAGGSVTFTVVATVAPAVPAGVTSVSNTAVVSHPDDPNPANDVSTDVTTLDAAPDLTVSKDNGTDAVLAGDQVTYTIDVGNVGDRGATGVVVVDELPVEVAYVSSTGGGIYDAASHTVRWQPGALPVGDTVQFTVTVEVLDPLPAGTVEVVNRVAVDDDGTNGLDPDPANNTSTDVDATGVDLTVTKVLDGASLTPGAAAVYTITVTNSGPATVDELSVDDTFPAGLVNPRFDPSIGSFDPVLSLWSGVALAPGGSVSLRVTVDVEVSAEGDLTNVVTVTPVGHADRDPSDNSSSTTDPVVPVVALELTKRLDGTMERGGIATYSFEVVNHGPSTATAVTVVDRLPAELTYEGFSGAGWACVPNGPSEVTCVLSDPLPAGVSSQFTLSAAVADDATGRVTNIATVSSAEDDGSDPSVASASADLAPPAAPDGPSGGVRPSALPLTGGDPWGPVLVGMMLLVAGALLVRRRRC